MQARGGSFAVLDPSGVSAAQDDSVVAVFFTPMTEPEYLICLQCETQTYQFEYTDGKLSSAICNTCGADDVSDFVTEDEFEEE